jgi:hypothetical protein
MNSIQIISYFIIGIILYKNELIILYKLFNLLSQIYLLYKIRKCIIQIILSDIQSYLIYDKLECCIFYIYCLNIILMYNIITIIID